jgi:hypothetical protein
MLSISQVAALLGIRKHRIEYAIVAGYLPEPKLRFVGKRAFDPAEVRVVASYFGNDNQPCSDPTLATREQIGQLADRTYR